MAIDEIGIALYRRYEKMIAHRTNWSNHWDIVSEHIVPRKDNIYGTQVRGEKKINKLFDTKGIMANEFLASALHGMLTNPSSIWFGLSSGDDKLDGLDNVQAYLQETVKIMIGTLNDSNFQSEIHEVYTDLGSFGTAVLRVEEDDQDIVRFQARPIYEHTISENNKGLVDTVFFKFEMSVRQIVEEFGIEVLDDMLKEKLLEDPDHLEEVLHAVQPATDVIPMLNSIGGKNFVSYKILKRTKTVLEKEGFFENPYIVPRWTKIAGEVYGRSPGMKALSDIKMANEMKRAVIEAAQLQVAPPMQVPDDGVMLPIKTDPRSINFYRAGTKDRIEPMNTGSNVQLGDQQIANVHAIIEEHFFLDQLKLVENDRMTATEVMQRRDEQLRTLGPILGRQHYELLKPLVERIFNILDRKGLLPETPEELVDRPLKVRYTSQIAKAQKAIEGEQIMKAMQLIGPFIETDPGVLDNIDTDQVVRFAADIYGLPHKVIRDIKERDSLRKERAQAQQQEAEAQQQNVQADTAQKIAGAEEQIS